MICHGPRISALAATVLINSTAMGNRGRLIAPGGLQYELADGADDAPAAGEPAAEFRPAWPGLLPDQGVAAAAFHHRLRHGAQRVDVHRGPTWPALAGADA